MKTLLWVAVLLASTGTLCAEPLGEYWGTAEEEEKYYRIVEIPFPAEMELEASSFEVLPDGRLAIGTRRGDIYFVSGAFDENPQTEFHRYAAGLDEVMGLAYKENSLFVTQQTEVTRITDTNNDGRADDFETLSDTWGFRNYHEFAFGSKPDADGNIWVALCLSESYNSKVPFRGWCVKVTPEGKTIPVCSGIRSPCGIGPNEHGVMFYAESQGPWNGSCSLKVLQPGGFMGHPVSFNWYPLAEELGPAPIVPNSPSRLGIERKRVKELVPYAVVFPYRKMGRSISGFMVDKTGGKFGPFENQIFIGDFSLSVVMRATTEQVNGVWQGACYPFREGLATGLLACQFTPQGDLIVGGTNRGWPVRGPRPYALQRLDWTGKLPFEIREINARPEGFQVTFTKPVDPLVASQPGTYQLSTFTHIYQQGYGSPEVDQTKPVVRKATVANDRLSVTLDVDGLVPGHVHEFHLPELRSLDAEKLLHADAYYTLNEIPKPVESTADAQTDNSPNVDQPVAAAPGQEPPTVAAGHKVLPLKGESFTLNGHEAFVILPKTVTPNQPWVWYAPTLPRLPGTEEQWMFQRFLDAGIAIAGVDAGESYGSPQGCELYSLFYSHLTERRAFHKRPVLLARSRGGLMLYNWAAENPHSVAGIAGIYPVCNIASYPGIERACGAYGLTAEQLQADLQKYNPIDRLESLAKAKVPILHIHGDQDQVVPLALNSELVQKRYQAMQAEMTLEVVEGQGHNMWSGWFQSENLVKFVLASVRRQQREHPVPESDLWLTYPGGDGPGHGKHVVLIAAEQEYRSEQSLPMLARILSQRHGFHCTVLFSVNEEGAVDPTLPAPLEDKTKHHRIPGLEHLARADCVIWLSRFMQLPDDQLRYFHDYFDSGKPLIALRTANHGFWRDMRYRVQDRSVGLKELLGGTFLGHHGGWHRESTRGIIVPENSTHPILVGVDDIWGTSDVYRCHDDKSPFPADCKALVMGQPLVNLEPDAPANASKEPLPIAWTKTWTGNQNRTSRIFHFTMGSAEDFANAGVRRLTINAVYWGLEMDDSIRPDSSVEIIGDYQPLPSGFNYEALGVKPQKPAYYK